jgi:CheY-like chemotaxis protein
MGSQAEPLSEVERILLVDAYGHSREGLSASLRGGGYGVETAAGVWEAIEKAKEARFGLAIIDVELPPAPGVAMNGWELAGIIRTFHPGAALILVTVEWRPDLKAQAEGLHRARLVEKPIHPGELRALVKALQSEGVGAVEAADRMKSEERRASWGTPGR